MSSNTQKPTTITSPCIRCLLFVNRTFFARASSGYYCCVSICINTSAYPPSLKKRQKTRCSRWSSFFEREKRVGGDPARNTPPLVEQTDGQTDTQATHKRARACKVWQDRVYGLTKTLQIPHYARHPCMHEWTQAFSLLALNSPLL